MRNLILAAVLSLPAAAAAYPNLNGLGEPHRSYQPTWQQPAYRQQQQTQWQIDELKRQRMQNCFNSGATILSYERGC